MDGIGEDLLFYPTAHLSAVHGYRRALPAVDFLI
jgi:hypothetical protein